MATPVIDITRFGWTPQPYEPIWRAMQDFADLMIGQEIQIVQRYFLKKCMWIALRIGHTNLVIPRRYVSFATARQIALTRGATAEQDRITPLRRNILFISHDAFDHGFNKRISPQENFFSAAVQAQ